MAIHIKSAKLNFRIFLLFAWILLILNFESAAAAKIATIFRQSNQNNSDMIIYAFPMQGWYLVSLPIWVADSSVAALFFSAIGAFSFDYDIYEYVSITTMQTGEGYWLAVNEASMARGYT